MRLSVLLLLLIVLSLLSTTLLVLVYKLATSYSNLQRWRPITSGSNPRRSFSAQIVLSNHEIDALKWSNPQSKPDRAILSNLTYLIEPRRRPLQCNNVASDGNNKPSQAANSREHLPKLLIVISSKWTNFARRARQRSTWLSGPKLAQFACDRVNQVRSVEYVFVLGSRPRSAQQTRPDFRVELESARHGDILLMSQLDDYRQLSRKHLAILNWISTNKLAQLDQNTNSNNEDDDDDEHLLVLKCDDDAFIELTGFLEEVKQRQVILSSGKWTHNWIMCAAYPDETPVLRSRAKWTVSRQDYPFDTYPAYCSGLAYLTTAKLLGRLWTLAQHLASKELPLFEEPFWIEDVFVTGLLPASMLEPPKVEPLNDDYCYSEREFFHRLQTPFPCLATELPDKSTYLQEAALHLNEVQTGKRAHKE